MGNANRINANEPEDTIEEHGKGFIHSFVIKVEGDSEEEESDAEENV